MELAITLTDDRPLRDPPAARAPRTVTDWRPWLDGSEIGPATVAGGEAVSWLHFGNAFCERLLPSLAALRRVLAWADAAELGFGLVTPTLTDAGVRRLRGLLPALPQGAEVIANDWGAVRLVRAEFPALVPVVGRVLCKMLKDPRLPSAKWTQLGASSLNAPGFRALLDRFGIDRVESDLPPFPRPDEFEAPGLKLTLHAPFGFTTKGRVCKVGSLSQPPERKFALDRGCAKECLAYVVILNRPAAGRRASGLRCFQRGNTIFYRHSPEMSETLAALARAGKVDRVVVAGDWNGGPE